MNINLKKSDLFMRKLFIERISEGYKVKQDPYCGTDHYSIVLRVGKEEVKEKRMKVEWNCQQG